MELPTLAIHGGYRQLSHHSLTHMCYMLFTDYYLIDPKHEFEFVNDEISQVRVTGVVNNTFGSFTIGEVGSFIIEANNITSTSKPGQRFKLVPQLPKMEVIKPHLRAAYPQEIELYIRRGIALLGMITPDGGDAISSCVRFEGTIAEPFAKFKIGDKYRFKLAQGDYLYVYHSGTNNLINSYGISPVAPVLLDISGEVKL